MRDFRLRCAGAGVTPISPRKANMGHRRVNMGQGPDRANDRMAK